MSDTTKLENIKTEEDTALFERKLAEYERIMHGLGDLNDKETQKIKEKLNMARIELKRASNIVGKILSTDAKKDIITLKTGFNAKNQYESQPGAPVICKIDVLNKPQPCAILLSNY